MDEVSLHVEVEVNPTESEEKVKRAVENVFGGIPAEIKPLRKGSLLVADAAGTEALNTLRNLLRRERIRDAARKTLLEGIDGKTVSFCLNKQVAYAGHISFSKDVAESPLGPIRAKIRCENPRRIIDLLTSKDL
jgi:predicted RNA binding protein with dsRBD fold (UPF0201 family)